MTTLDGPSYAHLHLSNPMFRPLYLPSTFDKTFLVPLFSCANLASVLFHVPMERTAFVVLFLIPNLLVSTRACWWWSLFPSSLCCLGSGFSFSPRNGWVVGSRLSPPIAISSPSIDTFRLDIDISPNG